MQGRRAAESATMARSRWFRAGRSMLRPDPEKSKSRDAGVTRTCAARRRDSNRALTVNLFPTVHYGTVPWYYRILDLGTARM